VNKDNNPHSVELQIRNLYLKFKYNRKGELFYNVETDSSVYDPGETRLPKKVLAAAYKKAAEELKKVQKVKGKLVDSVSVLSEKNKLNKRLIEQSLEQIDVEFNLLTRVGDGSVNYANNADDVDVERKSIFDRKI
jgi:hypothetical protein